MYYVATYCISLINTAFLVNTVFLINTAFLVNTVFLINTAFLVNTVFLINTAFLVSTPVWYYSNTSPNNIEMVVIFISSAPSNNTYRMLLCDSGYYSKLSCNDGNFIDRIQVITSNYKERGKMY